jgi:hypothetical protein
MVGELDGKDLDRDHDRLLQSEGQPNQIGEPIIEQQLTAKAAPFLNPEKCPLVGRPRPTPERRPCASAAQ